ncbi:hypothetical protein DCAR_0522360 [Daucus carota subsp. sativus]|uniref:Uncharacterized protein n=1 Tax=Daucus carota subsp. sativus TaxID=79200 RepID=A0A164ZRQ0_DAUCS|nr:hypothetical protein DCAR_0522360 [Daucus carota subsp. sativus]
MIISCKPVESAISSVDNRMGWAFNIRVVTHGRISSCKAPRPGVPQAVCEYPFALDMLLSSSYNSGIIKQPLELTAATKGVRE